MPILTLGNPVHEKILRKASKKVKDFKSPEILILVQEMRRIASEPGAAGIAAPQLGKNLRAFAISTNKKYPPVFVFNPVLKGFSEETNEVVEGCLSVPGKVAKLQRYKEIRIAWQDETGSFYNKNGSKYECTFEGFEAQAIQHEMNHIDGILCIDDADEIHDQEQYTKAFHEAKAKEEIELALKQEVDNDNVCTTD